MRRPRGLTVLELLVSSAVIAVLGLVLVRIYDVSRTAYATGAGRLALQQRARQAVTRITPRLVTAVPPSDAAPALYSPDPGAPPGPQVVYNVPAEPFDPRSPSYRRDRIFHQTATGLVLADADTPLDPSDDEVLARDIRRCTFEVLSQNAVRVTVDVYGQARGATNRDRIQDFRLQTVVQIPFYATR